MYKQFLSFLVLVGSLGSSTPNASAQAADFISLINGQTLENSDTDRYFNRRDCGLDPEQGTGGTGGSETDGGVGGVGGDGGAGGAGGTSAASALKAGPEDTTFEIRLQNTGGSLGEVWLWTGAAGAKCEELNQRQLENAGLCAEVAGNPRPVGLNDTLAGLTLQDLIDAKAGSSDIVQCDTSGLKGTPYQIFVFRGAPSNDVPPENYGVAPFNIDVESPAPPLVDASPQEASAFVINWANPNPPDDINKWQVWYSDSNDPSTAIATDLLAEIGARSITVGASDIGLSEPGDTAYLFMRAYDQAIINNDSIEQSLAGNQSELSEAVEVTFVNTIGFCESTGTCTGCSAAPMSIAAPDGPSALVWVFGLLVGMSVFRRRRR